MLTIPSGIIIAILTNIGAALTALMVDQIKFHSINKRNSVIVLTVFAIAYINSSLMLLVRFTQLE